MKACVVVPHYDHVDQFTRMLPGLVAQGLPIIVKARRFDEAPPDIKRLKFKNVIVPPRTVTLKLRRHGDNEVQFRFSSPDEDNSEGRIAFARPAS